VRYIWVKISHVSFFFKVIKMYNRLKYSIYVIIVSHYIIKCLGLLDAQTCLCMHVYTHSLLPCINSGIMFLCPCLLLLIVMWCAYALPVSHVHASESRVLSPCLTPSQYRNLHPLSLQTHSDKIPVAKIDCPQNKYLKL